MSFEVYFSHFVGVSEVLPNHQQRAYKPRPVKKAAHTMTLTHILDTSHCSLVSAIIEDVRRRVCGKHLFYSKVFSLVSIVNLSDADYRAVTTAVLRK